MGKKVFWFIVGVLILLIGVCVGIAVAMNQPKEIFISKKAKKEKPEDKPPVEPEEDPIETERKRKERKEIMEDREAFQMLMNYGVDDVYKEGDNRAD